MRASAENIRLGMELVRLGMDVYNWAERKLKGEKEPGYSPAASSPPVSTPPEVVHGPPF